MRIKKSKNSQNDICRRIAQVRLEVDGPRGKASFAKKLDLSPSTYDYYESSRIPPGPVLVRIADLAKVDLRWLLTGQSGSVPVPADHPAVARAAELLANHPEAAAPLAAFVELLGESMKFPAKATSDTAGAGTAGAPRGEGELGADRMQELGAASATGAPTDDDARPTAADRDAWIPVLGRSAAGVPQFWSDPTAAQGLTTLGELIDRHARRARPAAMLRQDADLPDAVQLITLGQVGQDNLAEFICAPAVKARHADAFAVRIDGESMAPDIRHGDLVVLSPQAPAADGKPAVVQLDGQIGVTCKLYRRAEGRIHLVPINEQYPPQSFPASKVLWALRVLARVRP